MSNDYTMMVPKEILDSAIKIEDWFNSKNVKQWQLMGMCSRNHVNDIGRLNEKLSAIKKITNEN